MRAPIVTAVVLTFSPWLRADPLVTATACGQPLSVQRDGAGVVTLTLGRTARPLGSASGGATVEAHTLGDATALVVSVRDGDAPALAAVVHCTPRVAPSVVWSGDLRWRGEDLGQRTRADLRVADTDGHPEVVVGTRNEAVSLCGDLHPLLDAQRLDGATGRMVATAVDPLAELGATGAATRATGAETQTAPFLAMRLRAVLSRGVAVEGTRALTDGDAASALTIPAHTVISATIDRGPASLRGVDFTAPTGTVGLPRRWTVLASPGGLHYDVDLPAGVGRAPGVRVHVPLVGAARASCLVLVAHDDGAVAEVRPETSLDDHGDPLGALAAAADGPDGEDAARLLAGAGSRGMRALADALPSFGTIGARRAVRLLDGVRGLGGEDARAVSAAVVATLDRAEVASAATDALRHLGAAAMGPLADAVTRNPHASEVVATMPVPLAMRATALARALDTEVEVWRGAREALHNVLPQLSREGNGAVWLDALPTTTLGLSRGLRAAAEGFAADDPARATVAARAEALWTSAEDFEARYRLLPALVGSAEGRAVVRGVLANANDADLRAESARVLRGTDGSAEALRAALGDRTPRVRAAAARALVGVAGMRGALVEALGHDGWPTVRIAAIEALTPDGEASEALASVLSQTSFAVVQAALVALGTNPGDRALGALMTFAEDGRRNPALRREAIDSLGTRCDPAALDALERIASANADPALPPPEQALGHSALASMARIDPARARQWLARAEANEQATAAVARAMRTRCERPTGR